MVTHYRQGMSTTPRRMSPKALAKRRTKAVARRLQRDVPLLLAAGLETAPDLVEAEAQVIRQRQAGDEWADRLTARQRQNRIKANWLRAFASVRVSPEQFQALDSHVDRALRGKLETAPELVCDWWLCALRDGARIHPGPIDAALAADLGYPPVEQRLPISFAAWRGMKHDPEANARVVALLEVQEAARLRKQGGAQLALPFGLDPIS